MLGKLLLFLFGLQRLHVLLLMAPEIEILLHILIPAHLHSQGVACGAREFLQAPLVHCLSGTFKPGVGYGDDAGINFLLGAYRACIVQTVDQVFVVSCAHQQGNVVVYSAQNWRIEVIVVEDAVGIVLILALIHEIFHHAAGVCRLHRSVCQLLLKG